MKRILILGGTGAMGMHLVQILADQGHKVYVTTRSNRRSSDNVEYLQGNAKDGRFLENLLAQQWDSIIDFMVYSTPDFAEKAALLLAATDHYIFLSSARVYAAAEGRITEASARLLDTCSDSVFLSTDEYSLAKARQEDILTHTTNKNWTIIRPYITYSEQRLQLGVLEKEDWLYRALKGRTIVFSKDIASKLTTLTYGLDVARGIAAVIGDSRALGQIYHITQCQALSWQYVLDVYLEVLSEHMGKRPKVLLLDLENFSFCKRSKYQIKYDRLFNREFDSSKISTFLGQNSFIAPDYGLRNCLKRFIEEPKFLSIDWRHEAIKDRYSREFAKFKEFPNQKQMLKYLVYRFIKT